MFDWLPDFFIQCGWAGFVTTFIVGLLVVGMLAATLRAWSKPHGGWAIVVAVSLLVFALLPAIVGELGFLDGMAGLTRGGTHCGEADRETIHLATRGEALACPLYGVSVSVFPAFGGATLLGIALMRRASRSSEERS